MTRKRPPEEDKLPGRCNALTRRNTWCQQWPLKGGKRCKLHGGASPRGPESASWRHGLYSAYLPPKLAESYEAALADPELVDAASGIALLDARLMELLGETGGGKAWQDAERLYRDLETAIGDGNAAGTREALEELGKHLRAGSAEGKLWREIRATLEDRRRQVDVQRRLMETRQQMVTVDRVMALVTAYEELVRRTVTSKAERMKLAQGMRTLLVQGE
jgi:hypothetical protein